MFLFEMGRKVNRRLKQRKQVEAGRWLHPVRRIERTAPLSTGRYVAMTFDDGPNALPANPPARCGTQKEGLSSLLMDILKKYNARGTFDVIGTTAHNYPDKTGKPESASWGGIRYDHYPDYGKDEYGGVANQLELAHRMIAEGHELANHGYAHIIFGPIRFIYGRREHFKSLDQVLGDLTKLHELVQYELGYNMKLSRPPHYIDKIPGGYSSYDAYRHMGYQYLAASFDGGGWKPSSGDYQKDVDLMVEPLQRALKSDASSLNGQIIFQKDGCNMSRQTPVADALDRHLKLLTEAGYQVVTVSELIQMSPFTDIDDRDSAFNSVRSLEQAGYTIGYRNNTFQPNRLLTRGELAMMVTPPDYIKAFVPGKGQERRFVDVPSGHPYAAGISWVNARGWMSGETKDSNNTRFLPDQVVTSSEFSSFLDQAAAGRKVNWRPASASGSGDPAVLQRRDIIEALAELLIRGIDNK